MATLRTRAIRLAQAHPDLRPHLLPIITASVNSDPVRSILDIVNQFVGDDGPKATRQGLKITTSYASGILEHYRDEPGHRINDQDDGYFQEMDENAERAQNRLRDLLTPYDDNIRGIRVRRSPKGQGLMDLEITLTPTR